MSREVHGHRVVSRVVGVYLTQSGKDGARIREDIGRDNVPRYSWIGHWGAGGGHSLADAMHAIAIAAGYRGLRSIVKG